MPQAVAEMAPVESPAIAPSPVFRVLGVKVNAIQIPQVVAQIERWIAQRSASHYIAVTGMHGVTEAQHDSYFKQILNAADMVVPDGMPLVWLGRRHGHRMERRVYGPEMMQTFCRETSDKYRHYFYGGAEGVPELLAETLQREYGVQVAGKYSPPFRPLTKEEDEEVIARINASEADVLWIGLSTPKQERWMYEHRDRLRVPVVAGVGAAFDLNTGRLQQAPRWMRENGLEWSFRLMMEPRRLWRRYLVYGSQFVCSLAFEALGLRSFE
jgi:N-acetylglucosaminyldiphosphoundecaprenol N-acetyl-beta-D-mannosaminyltransferase